MNKKLTLIGASLLMVVVLGGCSITAVPHAEPIKPTLGQQLIDLKRAREYGAITEREYQREKDQLIAFLKTLTSPRPNDDPWWPVDSADAK